MHRTTARRAGAEEEQSFARRGPAEGVGFEPTVRMTHNGFRDRPIRPLSHPSGRRGYSALSTGELPISARVVNVSSRRTATKGRLSALRALLG